VGKVILSVKGSGRTAARRRETNGTRKVIFKMETAQEEGLLIPKKKSGKQRGGEKVPKVFKMKESQQHEGGREGF